MQVEHAEHHADHVRMGLEHRGHRLAEVARRRRHAKDPVGLLVDERQPPIARDGQHAIAHAGNDVAEERVSDAGGSMSTRRRFGRRPGCPLRGGTTGFGHDGSTYSVPDGGEDGKGRARS
jgi:hypothetical protein